MFNIKPLFREYGNWFNVRIFSRAIFTFFTRTINIPSGKKAKIVVIPSLFFNNSQFLLSLIRGIGDTDFSLTFKRKNKKVNYYPVIKLDSASKTLVEQLSGILSSFGFNIYAAFDRRIFDKRTGKFYTKSQLYLSGNKNLELWMRLISFSNPKNLTKYLVWKKFGFCLPKTTLMMRRNILNGNVYPQSFYI